MIPACLRSYPHVYCSWLVFHPSFASIRGCLAVVQRLTAPESQPRMIPPCLLVISLFFPVLGLFSTPLYAGTISGQIQTATRGVVGNGTLTFSLSQPGVLSGSATLVTSTVSCYTPFQVVDLEGTI